MSADTDDGVGVKMLADHLVQVKEQYEERINALTNQMQELELEKTQMERAFKKMEKELDQKRVEILNMKRANVAQHAIEERENWKAVVMQQKSENKRLQSDVDSLKTQVQQLQNRLDKQNQQRFEEEKATNPSTSTNQVNQPLIQETEKITESHFSESPIIPLKEEYGGLDIQISRLLNELNTLRHEREMLSNSVSEAKKMNKKVTEQFITKVDTLEHDHQERENALLASIEALKLKLDLELEKKWELMQEVKDAEAEESQRGGFISYLWG